MLVRPLSRAISRALYRPLSGAESAITKVLIDLSPTSGSFYSLSTAIVFAGDFEIELDFVISNSTTFNMLLGKSGQTSPWVAVEGSGKISTSGLGFSASSSLSYDDGLLHTLKITRAGGVAGVFVDGTQAIPDTNFSGTLEFDLIGEWRNGGFSFNGIISDVKLTDITTPANSLEFGLNELTANTETNNGVTLTYQNIGTANTIRDTYTLSEGGTQLISDLRTIDIAAQA